MPPPYHKRSPAGDVVNPEVEGVIESFELAFKMQMEMPDVLDLSKESAATKALYASVMAAAAGVDAAVAEAGVGLTAAPTTSAASA